MSAQTVERPAQQQSALDVINSHRKNVGDATRLERIDSEFPYLALELGAAANNAHLLDLTDNAAGSFKWRGAHVGMKRAAKAGFDKFVTASAGNHAWGVALSAAEMNVHATVFVPKNAPDSKKAGIKDKGKHFVTVEEIDGTYSDCEEAGLDFALSNNAKFIHAFNDQDTIDGQATATEDLLRLADLQNVPIEQIVVPVGGGGLRKSVAQALLRAGRSDVRIIGVQAEGSNSVEKSQSKKRIRPADAPNTVFGGVAVKMAGPNTKVSRAEYPNQSFVTVPTEDVIEEARVYIKQHDTLLRSDLPMLEVTTLLAIAAMRHIDLSLSTVVFGTGANEHPSTLFEKRALC